MRATASSSTAWYVPFPASRSRRRTMPSTMTPPPTARVETNAETGASHDTQLHRPADFCDRSLRLPDADRTGSALHSADLAISGDRAPYGPDHHDLSRRVRRAGVAYGCDTARAADQWRREHDLHEQPVD